MPEATEVAGVVGFLFGVVDAEEGFGTVAGGGGEGVWGMVRRPAVLFSSRE